MPATIELAQPSDLDEIVALLVANQLPPEGLREHLATTFVARDGHRIVGCAALEPYADGALLRSVAVLSEYRGRRLGRALIETAIRHARNYPVPAVYLLTTTAEDYFQADGFERIARGDVPATVQASIEFTSACPSSATPMRKWLRSG
jgi:amino-acid N-acetyltransferase